MNRISVIQSIIDVTRTQRYLEIGVRNGETLFAISAPEKVGVDPDFRFSKRDRVKLMLGIHRVQLLRCTSDAFFASQAMFPNSGPRYGVVLIDGMHTYSQSLKDTVNALDLLDACGVVVLHDCNPPAKAFATPLVSTYADLLDEAKRGAIPGWAGVWNGDVWKTVVHLRSQHPELEVFTLDIDWGLGIVVRRPSHSLLELTRDQLIGLTYDDLAEHRETLLNLRPPEYFQEFLKSLSPS